MPILLLIIEDGNVANAKITNNIPAQSLSKYKNINTLQIKLVKLKQNVDSKLKSIKFL